MKTAQNPDLSKLGTESSPFEVPVTTLTKIAKAVEPIRGKHWYRVVYRTTKDDGKTWTRWMRFNPEVDVKSKSFNGQFATRAEAVAEITKTQTREAKERKRGKSYTNIGGIVLSMDVDKTARKQYLLIEELTLNVSDELIED